MTCLRPKRKAAEVRQIYNLDVTVIAANRHCFMQVFWGIRIESPDVVYRTKRKF